ncbi:MAG: glutamate 5-kinase [Trueperaceae bacterium]
MPASRKSAKPSSKGTSHATPPRATTSAAGSGSPDAADDGAADQESVGLAALARPEPARLPAGRQWRRIVVKVGTSSLTDDSGRISLPKLWALGRGLQVLASARGCKPVVVSSGAGAAGRERLGLRLPLTLPEKQAAAAVGQALLMLDWARALAPMPVAQMLLTAADIQDRERYVNAKHALEASLKLGAVPIVNENDSVATAEIMVGDNDTLSAWTAYLVGADALVILTDVDGLYDGDPRRNPRARRIDVVEDVEAVAEVAGRQGSERGTGGMVTKLRAAAIATRAGIETLVIGGGGEGLESLARGEVRGTRFLAGAQAPARKAWLAQQPERGAVEVDDGAARALRGGRSLLPSGVTAVSGTFGFGDAVSIRRNGTVIGRGLSNYDSQAVARIRGRQTGEIAEVLGHKDFDEIIHRDNLVLSER